MFRSKRPRDILNEIKWRFDLRRCKVYYIHRGAPGDIKIVEGGAIKNIDRSFLILEGAVQDVYIPYHRIARIDYDGTPVYMQKSPKNPVFRTLQRKMKPKHLKRYRTLFRLVIGNGS